MPYRSRGRGINRVVYPVSGRSAKNVISIQNPRGSTSLIEGKYLGFFAPNEHPLSADDLNWLYDNGFKDEIDALEKSLREDTTIGLGSIERESGLGITDKGIFFADNALWSVIRDADKEQRPIERLRGTPSITEHPGSRRIS